MIQAIFILLVVTLPLMYGLRVLLGRRVEALMMRSSSQAPAEPELPGEGAQQESLAKLRIRRIDSHSDLVQSDEARFQGAAVSRALFRRWCLYDAIALFAALLAWHLAHWYHFQHLRYLEQLPLGWLAIVYSLLIVVRYSVYIGRYKNSAIHGTRQKGWVRRWIAVGPEFLLRLYIDPRYAWYPIFFVVYILYETGREQGILDSNAYYGFTLFASTAFAATVLLRIHLNRLAQKSTNYRLLILRVFGRDENATLTFSALRDYWQQIGSTYTVVDPSFIRHKYQSNSEQHLAILFFSTLAWVYIFGTPEFNDWWGIALLLSVIIVTGYAIATVFLYTRAPNSFAASRSEIKQRLQRFLHRPRHWDLTFRDFDLYGFANTWKDAVSEFILNSEVIVMDLRGFSRENKGCETEIDLLFDTRSNDHFVFLVNSGSDLTAVETSLHERWEYLQNESPNLVQSPPPVTIYHSHDEDEIDMKCLINLLYSCTSSKSAGADR